MSYSVNTECENCLKKRMCVDKTVISYAVFALHELGNEKGHCGAGSVDLKCQNLVEGKKEDKE